MKNAAPIILIIIAIALFFIVIDPQYKEVKELSAQKQDNETLLVLAEELQEKRDRLHQDFNAISPGRREDLKKLLPDTVDNVRLVLDINNIAETYGMTITGISVAGSSGDSNANKNSELSGSIGTIQFGFQVSATYDVFLEFLRDLEQALRVVDIKSLKVNAGEGIFYNYTITLDTYWLR